MDEGFTVNAVLSIQEHGNTVLDSGVPYACPTYCYPTAFLIKLFGEQPSSYRLLSVVAGSLFILIFYGITKTLFSTRIALITTVLTTFSYWQIAWSRQARWYTLFALFFWLALFCFYQGISNERYRTCYLLGAGIFSILSILTHQLGILLPVIFTGWIIIDWVLKRQTISSKIIVVCITLTAIAFSLAEYYFSLFSNLTLHYVLPYYIHFYLSTYTVFILLACVGFFTFYTSYRRQFSFLLVVVLVYLLPLSFLTNLVQYRYLFHLTPIIFIGSALGMLALFNFCTKRYQKIIVVSILLIGLLSSTQTVLLPRASYYLESDDLHQSKERPFYAYTPQPNWAAAYTYIASSRKPTEIVLSSQPQFNKIYLGEAGYFINHDLLGRDLSDTAMMVTHEKYVNAEIIHDISELMEITTQTNGYIVFDSLATDNRLDPAILDYIANNFTLVFSEKTNPVSEIYVYHF